MGVRFQDVSSREDGKWELLLRHETFCAIAAVYALQALPGLVVARGFPVHTLGSL